MDKDTFLRVVVHAYKIGGSKLHVAITTTNIIDIFSDH